MILVDTCVIIEHLKENRDVSAVLNEIGQENIVLNSIIVMELIAGARDKVELNAVKRRLNEFQVVEIEQAIMNRAVSLMEDYYLSHGLKIPDAIIAATALFHEIPLLTFNKKDFRFIPGIILFEHEEKVKV